METASYSEVMVIYLQVHNALLPRNQRRSKHLRNVRQFLRDYMAQHPRRLSPSEMYV
jgi:hypothetical protein